MSDPKDLLEELDLLPQVFQRKDSPIIAEYTRDLTTADMEAYTSSWGSRGAQTTPSIQKIRYSHHTLARLVATGMKDTQAALVSGYTPVRVGQLRQDPLFKKLVEDYRQESKDIIADITERMMNVSLDMLEELHERLHTAPEEFTIPSLLDGIKTFADRTGHGPGGKLELTVGNSMIDRPPVETREEWLERKRRESAEGATVITLEPPTRPAE